MSRTAEAGIQHAARTFLTRDRLTISPNLLQELGEASGELVRQLADDGLRLPRPAPLSEAAFRWQHNEDAMATEKLAEGNALSIQIGSAQGSFFGDRQRMRQTLLILLDNAIRHTPAGGRIVMEATVYGKICRLTISDNGVGIPAEHLPHIFNRFYQANPTGEGQGRSNGLGLSIAKGIVEAQGGSISLSSRVGEGTRVAIEMPSNASL